MILTRVYGYGCIVLLCASLTFGALWQYEKGRKHKLIADMQRTQLLTIWAEQEKTRKAEDALAKALDRIPRTGQKVADSVKANPTSPDCVVPGPVADSLQDGIDSGKAATR